MQINLKEVIKPLEAVLMLKNSKIKTDPLCTRVFFELRHEEQKVTINVHNGCIASIFKLNCVDGSGLYSFLTKNRKDEAKFLSLGRDQVKVIIDFLKKLDEQSAQEIFNDAIKHQNFKWTFANNSPEKVNYLNFNPLYMFIAMKIFSKMEVWLSRIELKERSFEIKSESSKLGSEISFFGLGFLD